MSLEMSCEALQAFLNQQFPQVSEDFEIVEITPMHAIVQNHISHKHLRPGGTVSGPAMFALADVSVYLAILAMIGPRPLTVTTSCSIDFMRKPAAHSALIANARLLKLGKVLAVGDVLIYSQGQDTPVARASLTYSIPPVPMSCPSYELPPG